MQDNPYQMLRGVMQSTAKAVHPPGIVLGRVISFEPLTIKMGDMTLSGGDLLVNANLLPKEIPLLVDEIAGQVEAKIDDEPKSLAVESGAFDLVSHLPSALAADDRVLLQPIGDEPQYLVLCKVVSV